MLHDVLNLETVILPGDAAWPAPLSLGVALNEVVLIEGVEPAMSLPLLEVVATLQHPVAGSVRHWGRDAAALSREELYDLRRRIAYNPPRPVLLHLLSLGDNISLGPCYHLGCSASEALAPYAELLEQLELSSHLSRLPAQVSATLYARAAWARELVKGPELIVAVFSHNLPITEAERLVAVLGDYRARYGAAALLLGGSLETFYPLGHRLLRLEARQLQARPLPEYRARPLAAYLPLV
jgi:ABC-type lipoprotein export system ATPase subunit